MSSLSYRPEIDGLRAVAILSVVIFHAELGILEGGFVGVDVFFVISGFLISSIIVKEQHRRSFSIAGFYKRRALRIFPALFTVIAFCFAAGWVLFPPYDYKELANSAIATAAFYSNFYFENNANYFAAEAITQPLLHTWSLAVEEQFYFIAPWLLLLGLRYPRFLKPGFLLLLLASLVFSAILLRLDASKAFYFLPSRAFEMMIGMALALGLIPSVHRRGVAEAEAALGLAMIAAAALLYSQDTAFPGIAALLPCLGAAMIIHANEHMRTFAGRLLSARPVVFVGKISYSLYLWHWPFLAFAIFTYGPAVGPLARIGLILAAVIASILSYAFIEQPVRKRGTAFGDGRVLAAAAVAILVCLSARTFVRETDGASWRLPAAAAAFAAENPVRVSTSGLCRDGNGIHNEVGSDCDIGAPGAPQFLLFGDSHAQAIAKEVAAVAAGSGMAGHALVAGGCPPVVGLNAFQASVFDKCETHFASFDRIIAEPAIRTVVMLSRWAPYVTGKTMPNESRKRRRLFAETDEANRLAFEGLVTGTVERIRATGHKVVILGPVPELGFNLTAEVTKALMQGRATDFTLDRRAFDERNSEVLAFMARLDTMEGVEVLYPHDMLCDATRCRTEIDGKALYVDDDHLSPTGAAFIAPLIRKALED